LAVITSRIAAELQTAGIKFTHRPKSGFSPRRGDSLHRFMSNLAGPTDTWVRLALQNFTSIVTGVWECGPKILKFPLFARVASQWRAL